MTELLYTTSCLKLYAPKKNSLAYEYNFSYDLMQVVVDAT